MIVMKFGGTSLGSPAAIRNVLELVRAHLDRRPALVVSAHAGVTNILVELARLAPTGAGDPAQVAARHRRLCRDLGLAEDLVDPLLAELDDLVRGMRLVGEASPRAVDLLLSFGERCSARILAAFLSREGVPARALDAFALGLRTDSRFGRARPLADDGRIARAVAQVAEIPVITGYIAADAQGNITTLGRNGSDYSAALFGEALGAAEIQIWTDVDGVLTADPKLVPEARRIDALSFDEASEVAYYGGKVLHPATLLPAVRASIPVVVRNTLRPEAIGTRIVGGAVPGSSPVRAIVHKAGLRLVSVINPRMLMQPGSLADVFGVAARHGIDVGLVATSEVSITMTTDAPDLSAFAAELRSCGEVRVEEGQAIVGVVGHGIADAIGVPGQVFATLAREGIRVRVISQGAIKVNIALVVADADVAAAVRALHATFFGP
jgi:aspartate kinase